MRQALLILTKPLEPLNDIITGVERTLPNLEIRVADLTVDGPDYDRLLLEIFAAGSIQVW